MNSVRSRLLASDPLNEEPELPRTDVERIRQHLRQVTPVRRRPVLTIRAGSIAVLCVATLSVCSYPFIAARWTSESQGPVATLNDHISNGDTGRRQLQFVTPGGTRVIWVFDTRQTR
jgi:hypothetical protein